MPRLQPVRRLGRPQSMPTTGRFVSTSLALGLALTLTTACGPDRAVIPPGIEATRPAPNDPDVEALDLPANPLVLLKPNDGAIPAVQRGSAKVKIRLVTRDGGAVQIEPGLNGKPVIRFPKFVLEQTYPRAVILVENDGPRDTLSPGDRDFMWGADFKLDPLSFGSTIDNGDNVIQRGLFVHPAQFKAELDNDRAACSVLGDLGRVTVRASEQLTPDWWYRVRCERVGDELAVYVTEFNPEDGTTRTYASRKSGPMGAVNMNPNTTPLTVGGKIGADGEILQDAADQFNGWITNPVYALLK